MLTGDAGIKDKVTNYIFDKATGVEGILPTQREVLDYAIEAGLGDMTIKNYKNDPESGFNAFTLEDANGNVGILYAGSDFQQGCAGDWLNANAGEYFLDNSAQREQALEFFQENSSEQNGNYVFGISLGGNLTDHVFVENHEKITEAFVLNGNPIDEKFIDTSEKLDAFLSEKYNCNIICGDAIALLKSRESYAENINWIEFNGELNNNFLSSHLPQSAAYDENGDFKKIGADKEFEERMQLVAQAYNPMTIATTNLIQEFKESLNCLKDNELPDIAEGAYSQWKDGVTNVINNLENLVDKIQGYTQDKVQSVEQGIENAVDKILDVSHGTKDTIDLDKMSANLFGPEAQQPDFGVRDLFENDLNINNINLDDMAQSINDVLDLDAMSIDINDLNLDHLSQDLKQHLGFSNQIDRFNEFTHDKFNIDLNDTVHDWVNERER